MENPPDTQTPSLALEWRIENFSCWMSSAHENGIICRETSLIAQGKIELCLFPRAENGQGDRMMVIFGGSNNLLREEGDLFFVGPDESILYTRQVRQASLGIPIQVLGPKFLDVISLIEQKEVLHGDHLTLRFQYKRLPANRIFMRTTLDVLDTSFQITPPLDDASSHVLIASVSYHDHHESTVEKRIQVIYHAVGKVLYLEMSTEHTNRSFVQAVQCQVSVFDNSDVLVTHEKREYTVIIPGVGALIFDTISMLESGSHAVLRLKIISGTCKSNCHDIFQSTTVLKNASKNNNAVSLVKRQSSFSLSEDLRCLYRDGEFPDFTLKCGTVSFPVHKNILGVRSPVFKTMLSSDMIEAASGSVDIEDLDAASLDHFLTYLYTGTFKDVPCDSALKLYYAADKYQVPSLKEECTQFLSANLSISNACDILCLGDLYEDEQLTSAAQNFILKHSKEVTSSKEWQDHMQTNPQLLVKTFNHFAANGFVGYPCL